MKRIFASVLILAAAAAFGCQKGGGETKSFDPCELVTQADAEAALGVKLGIDRHDVEPANATGQKICMYGDASGQEMKFVQISLQSEADMSKSFTSSGQGAATLFDNLKTYTDDPAEIPGVGSAAFFGGSGLKPGAGLTVLTRDKRAIINITVGLGRGNQDRQAHIDIEKSLAQKALGRMAY